MAKIGAESNSSKGNSGDQKKKKNKSSKTLVSVSKKAFKPESAPNPFETIWSRSKFNIVGRRRKGEERRIGLARSLAVDKRKKTLLKEYEQSGKSSKFLDRRIGEKDDTLQEFDKAILRLQRERQLKLKRASKFNLADEEEDEPGIDQLRSLSKADDFEDDVSLEDDDGTALGTENSEKHISLHGVNVIPRSSSPDEENKYKTKKQVMTEIISKSKYFKAEKAKGKEEDDQLMGKLDEDFTSLAQSKALVSLTQPSKMNALKTLLNKNTTKQSGQEGSSFVGKESVKKEQPDAYDKLVKEMVLDMRARPSDRTKTPEEIAQEERERLEELEEERQKRILAADDSSNDDSDGVEDSQPDMKKLKYVSGDDLGDSFLGDEDVKDKSGWVDDIYDRENVDNDDEDSTSSNGSEGEEDDLEDDSDSESDGADKPQYTNISTKEWEQSDEDDMGADGEAEDREGKEIDNATSERVPRADNLYPQKMSAAGKKPAAEQDKLPYVIAAPANLTELCSLLENRSDTEVAEAVNRIRACNSIKLAAENRRKMQVFYGVLLQYFAVLATRRPLNIRMMNLLVKPLIEMGAETPYFAAICARERLIRIRTQFCEDFKFSEKSSWPSLKTLLLFRLWTMTFPCSDFRHVVMTPAILLMCEYLMRCPVSSGRDIAIGTFLCSMLLSVTRQSQKFCPEAMSFLQTLLLSALDRSPGSQQLSQFTHLVEFKELRPWLHIRSHVGDLHSLDFLTIMDLEPDSPFFSSDSFRASILVSVVETLRGFVNIYEKLSSFPEIFSPASALLREVANTSHIPEFLRSNMIDAVELIQKKCDDFHMLRQPLQMRKQKPEPIRLLTPKFEENFVKSRDYDPDRERAERKKLKKLLKRETRGAMRELSKDNRFISQLKEKDRLEHEEERAEMYGKARAFLQEQEHAFKSGQLGKGRKRRK